MPKGCIYRLNIFGRQHLMYEDSFPWFWAKTIFEIFWPFYRRNSLRNGKSLKMQWWHRTKLMSKWPKIFLGLKKIFDDRFKRLLRSRVLVFYQKWPIFGPLYGKFCEFLDPSETNKGQILADFGQKTWFFEIFFQKFSEDFMTLQDPKISASYHRWPKKYRCVPKRVQKS